MAGDQNFIGQIQQRVRGWMPHGKCNLHTNLRNCVYNRQKRLTKLHLCGLNLVQIPSEVWQCSLLKGLYLADNRLTSLPTEINELPFLEFLDLSGNQLTSLPTELGQLRHLISLHLNDNRLISLPMELGRIPHFYPRNTDLAGNPLPQPKFYITERQAFLSYLQTLQQQATPATKTQPSQQINPLVPFSVAAEESLLVQASSVPSAVPPASQISTTTPPRSIKIFYCYAREDCDLRDRIDKHLGVLKRLGQVTGWYDREIQAGTEWEREIEAHLSVTNIILLLVSADFVNSDYCYGMEMLRALEMHEQGKACVLPILLRLVDWQDAPFAKLQLLPTGAKPITSWLDPEKALEDVARQIRVVVNALRTHQH